MKKIVTTLLATTMLLGVASIAAAQDHGARNRANIPAADLEYTFDDHAVEGGRYSPDGTLISGRTRRHRQTLIRPRVHFIAELTGSVERI